MNSNHSSIPTHDIPEIPWELVDEGKRRMRKFWAREDLDLRDPALLIGWARPENPIPAHGALGAFCQAPVSEMIHDPEIDVRAQLQRVSQEIEHLEAGREIGHPVANFPGMHLLHYGTGALSTAFGSKMIVRVDDQPFYEARVHTPEEAMRLREPDLHRDGVCPQILERIEYYNEATQGKIPLCLSDNVGPWTMATQVWHYEDMLAATLTAPEAVRHVLGLVTDSIIEWDDIQITRMRHWVGSNTTSPFFLPRGFCIGDDTLVTVSPKMYETYYLPYNNRISRHYGGVMYHCCMHYDSHFAVMAKTEGFIGFDPSPEYNDIDKVEAALAHHGVWTYALGDVPKARHGTTGRRDDLPIIRRLKGKVGMILSVHGDNRQDAIDRAKRLLDSI
jgi:hypothetical protein